MKNGKSATNFSGKLIAVEGLDGSGKSTQIYLVKRWLELEGYKVFLTEWNSSQLVKQATKKGKKRQLLTPTTFALIHCTDFADRYEREILPLLSAGYIVLADRYIFTAFARDAARGCEPQWIRKIYNYAKKPDMTFFFEVPLDMALSRILDGRPQLKYYEAGMDLGLSTKAEESFRLFQSKIYDEYKTMVGEYGFTVINASRSPDQMHKEVRNHIEGSFELKAYKWSKKML